MGKKHIVVLTGAGISAESGIKTFRDSGGLWENHDVMEVASIQAWYKNPELMLRFYNDRRKQASEVEPNAGHIGLVDLEEFFDVTIITQNVDNLHEKAGSSKVLHLHGELNKVRSSGDESLIYDWSETPEKEIEMGDLCDKGHQLRPHIVWFGEAVPMMDIAVKEVITADIFMVVGTSLAVYPAAGLVDYVERGVPKYIIDPNIPTHLTSGNDFHFIEEKGSVGVPMAIQKIKEVYLS